MSAIRATAVAVRTALLAWTVAACTTSLGSPAGSTGDTATPIATAPPSSEAPTTRAPTTPVPSVAGPGVGAPPVAVLAVDGGDPVAGQLGTYVWDGGGSDSPWLPGTPIGAATGELLTASVAPDLRVSGWSALLAPAAAGDGTGAVSVGTGRGSPDVIAPASGTWTLALTVTFGERGTATWFWRLEVP